ncbi:MAG TPA: hypothetical protein VLM79_02340 [Kofleriaceae bacterium]|nr:hypothetical protein [Kofleriaceae bacterium]
MIHTARTAGRCKRVLAVAVAFAVTTGARPALADPHAEAVVLFDQGIKDMKAGRLDKACPELQASLDLVKDSGTKGALARCHGLAGRLASAWLLWRELTDTAPSAELRADAAAQATRLEPRLPRYSIRIAAPSPRLVVQINGRRVSTSMPLAVPVDPGKVSVIASERDGDRALSETWKHEYTAVEGQTLTIEIPALARAPETAVEAPPPPPPPVEPDPIVARRHTRHVIALVIGGVALGAAAGGAVYGFDARSKYREAKKLCGGVIAECIPEEVDRSQQRVDAARTSAMRSNILFGAAGAAAIAAAIVWFTAPSPERKGVVLAPAIDSGSIGVALTGAF